MRGEWQESGEIWQGHLLEDLGSHVDPKQAVELCGFAQSVPWENGLRGIRGEAEKSVRRLLLEFK